MLEYPYLVNPTNIKKEVKNYLDNLNRRYYYIILFW